MDLICDNGGWCWYQDPRVIVDRDTGKVLLASTAGIGGVGGQERKGDAQVSTFDPKTGLASTEDGVADSTGPSTSSTPHDNPYSAKEKKGGSQVEGKCNG